MKEACAAVGLPLHAFPWQPRMGRAGLRRGSLYLVRPDGHVALADPEADPERLRDYRKAWAPTGAMLQDHAFAAG